MRFMRSSWGRSHSVLARRTRGEKARATRQAGAAGRQGIVSNLGWSKGTGTWLGVQTGGWGRVLTVSHGKTGKNGGLGRMRCGETRKGLGEARRHGQ